MKCEICESEIPNDATYCTECGLMQENRFGNQFNPIICDPFVTRIQPDYSSRLLKSRNLSEVSSANNFSGQYSNKRSQNLLSIHKLFQNFQTKKIINMFVFTLLLLVLLTAFLCILFLE